MVAPIVAAAGISAGGALLGGLLSDRSARSTASKQRQMDIEFAKNQIAWKVADAKRAGIHPLYALGASGSYAPTNIIQGQSNTGSALGRASSQIADMYMQSATQKQAAKTQAPLMAAQVNAANQSANRDAAQAALALSQSKRVEQEINATALGRGPNLYNPFYNQFTGKTEYFPNPDSGLQPNEAIGTGYWGLPKVLEGQSQRRAQGQATRKRTRDWLNKNIFRKQYRKPYYPSNNRGTIRR